MTESARRFAATPARSLLPCSLGMAIGLAIDCGPLPPEVLASLCRTSQSWLASVVLHWTVFPAMHTLMLLGALATFAISESVGAASSRDRSRGRWFGRACAHGACLAAMLVGMTFGGALGPLVSAAFGLSAFGGLMAGMMLGMTGGVILVTPVYGLIGAAARTQQRRPARTRSPRLSTSSGSPF